ncbi:MAG: hypothetical protein QF745_08310 [Planctomycetota bacterium]|nr:hypothetical protein [Planctomycetota bacterium]
MNEMNDTVGAPIFNIPQDGTAAIPVEDECELALAARLLVLSAQGASENRPIVVAKIDEGVLEIVTLFVDGMAEVASFEVQPGPMKEIEREIVGVIISIVQSANAVTDMNINQVLCGFGSSSLLME